MSKSSHQREPDQERDQLVAYLDGELGMDDCKRIEQRLADDEDYLKKLQGLDKAWHALEQLPAVTVGDSFTKTTIEMVTTRAASELATQTTMLPVRRRRRFGLLIFLALLATTVGFATARMIAPHPDRLLLADLPVIQNAEALSLVPNIQFLEKLQEAQQRSGVFDTDSDDLDVEVATLRKVANQSSVERREHLVNLAEEEQLSLNVKRYRYWGQFDQEERRRMRTLYREIKESSKSAELERTLLAFGHWLDTRSDAQLAELREANPQERMRLMRRWISADIRSLSDEELDALREKVLQIVTEFRQRHAEQIRQLFKPREAERFLEAPPRRVAPLVIARILREPHGIEMIHYELSSVLEDQTQQMLRELPRDREAKQMMLGWIREAFQTADQSDVELENYFVEKLTNEDRERLLALPWDQMQQELAEMYEARNFGFLPGELREKFRDSMRRGNHGRPGPPRLRDEPGRGPRDFGPPPRHRFDDPNRPPRRPPEGNRRRRPPGERQPPE